MRGITLGIRPTQGINFLTLEYLLLKPNNIITEKLLRKLVLKERRVLSSLNEVCHRLNSLH